MLDFVKVFLEIINKSLEELAEQHSTIFTKPTIIWEGVTNYLTEDTIKKNTVALLKF